MSADPAAARRMVNAVSEEEEAAEARRYVRYQEMLWEQIEGTHERYKANMESFNHDQAGQESWLYIKQGAIYFGGLTDA